MHERFVRGTHKVHVKCVKGVCKGTHKVHKGCASVGWVIIGNLKFEAYFEVFGVVDSLRILKVHHCLSLVTISNH